MKISYTPFLVCCIASTFLVSPSYAQASESTTHKRQLRRRRDKVSSQYDDKERRQLEDKVHRVVVTYSDPKGREDALKLGGKVYHDFDSDKTLVLDMSEQAISFLNNQDDYVVKIEYDSTWYEQGYMEEYVSSNEHYQRKLNEHVPYGITLVQADQVQVGDHPVTVCIADTGVARKHPDILRRMTKGEDRLDDHGYLRWRKDFKGHGTHVAGTVSAQIDNGIGVRGVGKIPLFITRALDDSGSGSESDIYEAVRQCVESGAKIVSLSLGGGSMSSYFTRYMEEAYQNGVLFVAATGNEGLDVETFPAALPSVVGVGAVNEDLELWENSNWGRWTELVAPGDHVYSTTAKGNQYGYAFYSGTSMATPHVAGVAALLWSHHPTCTNTQIRYAMAYSAKRLPGTGNNCDNKTGNGLVQAKTALDFLDTHPCHLGNWGRDFGDGGCDIIDVEA